MNNPILPLYKQADPILVRSKDCYAYDAANKRYIDFESGDWSANLGHSNELISERIKQQLDKLIHDGLRFRNEESEQLAVQLLSILGLEGGQCAFLNSGSEAVNLGISLAKKLTGRNKVLKMDCSYLSAYGHGQAGVDNTGLVNIPIDSLDAIDTIDFAELAAFVFEPGNSSSLVKYPDPAFIQSVAAEIKKHGGLLMANEVTTGFGRTGKWFGFQHYEYKPEIVAVGKALGNGYPVSGVAVSSALSEMFLKKPFRYAQSHQNDALGCAVGSEVIRIIKSQDLIRKGNEKGIYFRESLGRLQLKYPVLLTEVRARGLMLAIELASVELAEALYANLLDRGFLVGLREKTIRFMPPLTIEQREIDLLVKALEDIFEGI